MKNLSIDLNFITFPFENFTILTTESYKNEITDIVKNFNKKMDIFSGRGAVYRLNNSIIRQYLHGGIFRNFLKDNFFSSERFINEFKMFLFLNYKKFPTAKVVGTIIFKKLFYKGFIVTEEIPNVNEIQRCLTEEVFYNAGVVAGKLHAFNIIHGDMHLKNFVSENNGNVYLLDFDKSFLSEDECLKIKDIKRFLRSILKYNYFNENKIEKKIIDAFLNGYGEDEKIFTDMKITVKNRISWFLNKR